MGAIQILKSVPVEELLQGQGRDTKAQIKASDDLRKVGKAREAKLEKEMHASKNAIRKLEGQIVEKDEELTKGLDYATKLETRLDDADSKMIPRVSSLYGQLQTQGG